MASGVFVLVLHGCNVHTISIWTEGPSRSTSSLSAAILRMKSRPLMLKVYFKKRRIESM